MVAAESTPIPTSLAWAAGAAGMAAIITAAAALAWAGPFSIGVARWVFPTRLSLTTEPWAAMPRPTIGAYGGGAYGGAIFNDMGGVDFVFANGNNFYGNEARSGKGQDNPGGRIPGSNVQFGNFIAGIDQSGIFYT